MKITIKSGSGFTVTELMVAASLSLIVMLGVMLVMSNNIQGFQAVYEKAGGITADGFVAQKAFDKIVRKATYTMPPITNGTGNVGPGTTLDAYFIVDPNSGAVNQRAHFYISNGTLYVGYYSYPDGAFQSTQTVCADVQSCSFERNKRAIQMVMLLAKADRAGNTERLKVVTSSYLHN